MDHLEIEVKFLLEDLADMRERIIQIGGVCNGPVFESNIRFESGSQELKQQRSLLRLRQDQNTTLTFKREPLTPQDQFKIHTEYEVQVDNFDVMKKILEALGFHQEQVYEKKRETIFMQDTMLCIDRMPFGPFLEIEGSQKNIREMAHRLGLAWEDRILLNYIAIFDRLKQACNLPFSNITFKNFERFPVDVRAYRYLFEG